MEANVIYWRSSVEPQQGLIGALGNLGLKVHEYGALEDILDHLEKKQPILLIADATFNRSEAFDRITQLSTAQKLFNWPLLFIGVEVGERADVLRRNFRTIRVLAIPCNLGDVLEFLSAIWDGAPGEVPRKRSLDEEIEEGEVESKSQVSRRRGPQLGKVEADDTQVRLQKYRDPIKLLDSCGGKVFSIARNIEDFDDDVLLPDHPDKETIRSLLEQLSDKSEWVGLQARRAAFVAAAIGNSLNFGKERDSNVRLVSLFFNLALVDSSRRVLNYDLLEGDSEELRCVIGDGFRRSADVLEKCFDDERAAQTLRVAAKLILGGEVSEDETLLEDAKCALAVELTSRSCWWEGCWNPQGAYRAIRLLRSKRNRFIDDEKIVSVVIRMLAESVSEHVTIRNVYVPGYLGTEEFVPYEENEGSHSDSEDGVKIVLLSELMPGMRLAKPLTTVDKKLLLVENTLLDREMVFLLWQLCAIRALDSKVAIWTKS